MKIGMKKGRPPIKVKRPLAYTLLNFIYKASLPLLCHILLVSQCYLSICEWTDPIDGKVYVFVSPNLWFDPTDLIARRNITSFPVQIDSEDPSYYYVDISCLQNRTDE